MRTYYKIYQIDSQFDIQDPKTKSTYGHNLYSPVDDQEYDTRKNAIDVLTLYLKDTNNKGEYAIWELHSN